MATVHAHVSWPRFMATLHAAARHRIEPRWIVITRQAPRNPSMCSRNRLRLSPTLRAQRRGPVIRKPISDKAI
jgi:hypothetical protein